MTILLVKSEKFYPEKPAFPVGQNSRNSSYLHNGKNKNIADLF